MVHIGVCHAGQQIRRARPERRETYSGFAGEQSIDISHEGRALLMPSRDDTNPGIEQCIGDMKGLFARQGEQELDPFFFKTTHDEFGGLHHVLMAKHSLAAPAPCIRHYPAAGRLWSSRAASNPLHMSVKERAQKRAHEEASHFSGASVSVGCSKPAQHELKSP